MKRLALYILLIPMLLTSANSVAQWAWQGQLYFGVNQNLFVPVNIVGDVDVTVAEGFTVRSPQEIIGNGFTMVKKGGGRFWFQNDNPSFDANIVYVGKSDTVQLDGIFGHFQNDSIGYLYAGNIISSDDSVSFFYLHQNDTVVQTFNAHGYNNLNTNLYLYSDTKSTLRLIHSSDSLAGKVELSNGGTLYIDGTKKAKVLVKNGLLITGENSAVSPVVKDYARFASWTSTDTAIAINNTTMQIGAYNGPSLAFIDSGNVYQDNNSILKIDVYDPNGTWSLTTGIHTDWANPTSSTDTIPASLSDKIYMKKGNYNFGTGSKIDVNWNPAYIATLTGDVFYLPVIMTTPTSGASVINGANNVTVDQTLPGWLLRFIIGDGTDGTNPGWGYITGSKIMMKKTATLNGVQDNGTYPNPVSVLYSDTILYELEVFNPGATGAYLKVIDTLPPYLDYDMISQPSGGVNSIGVNLGTANGVKLTTPPEQYVLTWTFNIIQPLDTLKLWYKATPASGACASQPLYINKAYVEIGNPASVILQTNSTYHQGAGVAVTTFSASLGGQLYNAHEQALDYRTSPRSGILIAPDEGYAFAGWSHKDYTSLRGETIPAEEGIMLYDTLTIYGDVELRANFELEKYPVQYYLNGSQNPEVNPNKYTIQSEVIQLEAPFKQGDTFTGWTGSNGDTPQINVSIPQGSTGERVYYANFALSGKEGDKVREASDDKIWSADDNLYIQVAQKGSIARIYTTEGILQRQLTIVSDGATTIKLGRGVYVVTINNGKGHKVFIE
jgi:uncharacterized repeat protein (TIGR02543 family)